jgi:hypothetical protein
MLYPVELRAPGAANLRRKNRASTEREIRFSRGAFVSASRLAAQGEVNEFGGRVRAHGKPIADPV